MKLLWLDGKKKNGHLSGRKTKDKENPGMKTKTWLNPFTRLEA